MTTWTRGVLWMVWLAGVGWLSQLTGKPLRQLPFTLA